jgi:hypothetical protein
MSVHSDKSKSGDEQGSQKGTTKRKTDKSNNSSS